MQSVYFRIGIVSAIVLSFLGCSHGKKLVVYHQETEVVYATIDVKDGDILVFEWEHSFEHVKWKEFYRISEDNVFALFTIAVEGFGAGIPAEMDCTYRYADGLVYMENIRESRFKDFNWIHSQTHLKRIILNDQVFIEGHMLPEREKIALSRE